MFYSNNSKGKLSCLVNLEIYTYKIFFNKFYIIDIIKLQIYIILNNQLYWYIYFLKLKFKLSKVRLI